MYKIYTHTHTHTWPWVCTHTPIHSNAYKMIQTRDFWMVQWLRIHSPMQGTQVQSLVLEDSTCHRATEPGTKPLSQCFRAQVPQAQKPVLHNKRSHQDETSQHHNQRGTSARHNQRKSRHSNEDLAHIFKKQSRRTHTKLVTMLTPQKVGDGEAWGQVDSNCGFIWIISSSQNVSVTCVLKNNEFFKQSINM